MIWFKVFGWVYKVLEKRFYAVSPQPFTSDGTTNGVITIAGEACSLFKVKQKVIVAANSLPPLTLEIKEIDNQGNIQVGPIPGPGVPASISSRTDISAYTVALGANIFADLQKRPAIDYAELMRAVYDEEPAVRLRTGLVDECGDAINNTNPLPVVIDGTISVADVTIVGPGGSPPMNVNSDGSINVNLVSSISTPGLSISYNEVTSVAAGVETTILSVTAPSNNYRVQKVELSGDNVALFKVKLNNVTIVTKRTWWTAFNQTINFEDFSNGLLMSSGQTLTVTALHNSLSLGTFEATVMAVS